MSKKLTSFVVLLAAALLAVPAQAQTFAKKKGGASKLESLAPMTSKQLKHAAAEVARLSDKTETVAFRGHIANPASFMVESLKQMEENQAALDQQMKKNLDAISGVKFGNIQVQQRSLTAQAGVKKANRAEGEVVENDVIVGIPEGDTQKYMRSGLGFFPQNGQMYYSNQAGLTEITTTADNTVYIKNFISKGPSGSYVKGTKEGNTITIPVGQVVYFDAGYGYGLRTGLCSYDAEAGFVEDTEETAFILTFDEATNTYTLSNALFSIDTMEGKLAALFYTDDASFSGYADSQTVFAPFEEPVATTGANIDALPYSNTLMTEEEFGQFGVIDYNFDNSTWTLSSSGARYRYHSSNVADDWLISPAIKLEKGKIYTFSIDANCAMSSYPEKFEVKMGKEAKAAAMTTTVIPETVVNSSTAVTYTNEDLMVSEDGYYHIGIHAISDPDNYYLYVKNFKVEIGAEPTDPAAVSDFTAQQVPGEKKVEVSFKAPTMQRGGENYLTENVFRIDILQNGEKVKDMYNVTPGTAQKVTLEVPANGKYTYQAITYADGRVKGAKSEAIDVTVRTAVAAPYTFDFSDPNCVDVCYAIDHNNDGLTWAWNSSYNAASYGYNANVADDYLVTLPIYMEKGKFYNVVVNAYSRSTSYPEQMEVLMGKEPTAEAMTMTLIPATVLENTTAADYEQMFQVEEDGYYYVGVHAISDANMWYLLLNSVKVDVLDPGCPAAPAIELVPGAEGDLSATVKVTAPAKSLNDEALTDNVNIELYQNGEVVETFTDVAPGAIVRKFVEPAEAGMFTFQAIPANTLGTGMKSDKVSSWIGIDIPFPSEKALVKDTENSLIFEWDAATTEGINGGYVNPATVKANIWTVKLQSFLGMTFPVLDQIVGTSEAGATTTEVAINPEEGDQTFQYFAVQPFSESGHAAETYTGLLIGQSYTLPMKERFAGTVDNYFSSNGAALFTQEGVDDDGICLNLLTGEVPEDGVIYLQSGKINISQAENPMLTFNVKSPNIQTLYVAAIVNGTEEKMLGTVNMTSRFQIAKFPLAELKDSRYVQIVVMAQYTEGYTTDSEGNLTSTGDYFAIDDLRVTDMYQYNLAIDVKATPATMLTGQTATVVATVENLGENAAQNYTVTITAGRNELLKETPTKKLSMFGKKQFTVELPTSIFDNAEDINIKAEVEFDTELQPEDNTAETIVALTAPAVPVPENLVAEDNGETGVDLTWTAPTLEGTAVEATEGFDDTEVFPEFSIGGITAEEHKGALGDWTLYDGNGTTCYGFNGLTVPNLGSPSAFIVMNPASTQLSQDLSQNYPAHSGSQYLMSVCNAEPEGAVAATDHWLISPVLPGDAQNISLYAREITNQYGAETFDIMVSTTDNNIESFTKLGETYSVATTEWTEFTAALPEGTKYFAIRHNSTDVFGLMVDDITFTSVGGALSLSKFNVYFQGELIATVEGDVTTYLVPSDKLTAGKRMSFDVTAVYSNGVESLPATALIEVITVTGIDQISVDGKPVDVYSLDGKLLRSQATSLAGLKGIYVINGKKYLVK